MNISPRLRYWLELLAIFAVTSALVRLILAIWVVVENKAYQDGLVTAFFVGLPDDLAMAIALGLPFLFGLYVLRKLWATKVGAGMAHVIYLGMVISLIFTAVSELFFWNEYSGRFNGIAVYYLIFPKEVIGNIRESFDLRIYLPPIFVVAFALYWFTRHKLSLAITTPEGDGKQAVMAGMALLCLASPVLYFGPFEVTRQNRQANEVAANGYHTLFHAFITNDSKYDGIYAGMPEEKALPIIRELLVQPNTKLLSEQPHERGFWRHVDNGNNPKKLNVVLVMEESYGSVYYEDVYQEKQKDYYKTMSPNWHEMAKDGLFFRNIYSTGDRTVRGLEAVFTSFPPIPGISTARRAGSEGMNSLPQIFEKLGYKTAFLYGGPDNFDNMGDFWRGIGFNQVWDQDQIKEQGFTTIWGVADEYLFTEALKRMDENTGPDKPPFFFSMLTVTNHRPFMYPEGRVPFKPAKNKRDHAAAYADWALGDFVKRAKDKPWFKDTVFVMIGDHGPKVWGASQLPVQAFRVPFLIYSPGNIEPQEIKTLGSSLDLGPTLLGAMGFSYDSPFFGLDLLKVPEDQGRISIAHNFDVAFGDGKHVGILTPKGEIRTFSMQTGPYQFVPVDDIPETVKNKLIAQTQTAHRMFYAGQYHETGRNLKK